MMHHAYVPVIAAAAAEIAVGFVWYSDHLFGPAMRKAAGEKKKKKNMIEEIAMHFVVALAKATALYIVICMMQHAKSAGLFQEGFAKFFTFFAHDPIKHNNTLMCALKTASFIWVGFLLPSRAIRTIWGSKNWNELAITSGGQLAMTLGMATAIALFS